MLKNAINYLLEKKHTKSVKRSKIINYQPKSFENSIIVEIKSIFKELSKPSHKLSKTIIQAKK